MNPDTIQQVFNIIVQGVGDGWTTINFFYKGNEARGHYYGDYGMPNGSEYFDPDLILRDDRNKLMPLMQQLQSEIAQLGGEPFTHCLLHFTKSGEFTSDYNYNPINWTISEDPSDGMPTPPKS